MYGNLFPHDFAEFFFDVPHIVFVVENELSYFADGDEVDALAGDFVYDKGVFEWVFYWGFVDLVEELGQDGFEFDLT